MAPSKEAVAWLQISLIRGVGPKRLAALYATFDSGSEALSARGDAWLRLPRFTPELVRDKLPDIGVSLAKLERLGVRLVARGEVDYPEPLEDCETPPTLLYMRGDPTVLQRPTAAVVGTRRASYSGVRSAARLSKALAAGGVCIVSGLARGIDRAAHDGALAAPGGVTAAVLAGGLDRIYPPEHKALAEAIAERGVLISETPFGVKAERFRFPVRNRIIAALSSAVIVAEAPPRSGALQTAELALKMNRDVYAVPQDAERWNAAGSNRLLVDTQVAIDATDVVCGSFRWADLRLADAVSASSADGGADAPGALAERVLRELADGPRQLDALSTTLGANVARLAALLVELELTGRVERIGAQLFALSESHALGL